MFATHYHELTELADRHGNIRNLSVAVSEDGSDIVFLHNIVDGPASKSYGNRLTCSAKAALAEFGEKAEFFVSLADKLESRTY